MYDSNNDTNPVDDDGNNILPPEHRLLKNSETPDDANNIVDIYEESIQLEGSDDSNNSDIPSAVSRRFSG
jgi:hypothetical protein